MDSHVFYLAHSRYWQRFLILFYASTCSLIIYKASLLETTFPHALPLKAFFSHALSLKTFLSSVDMVAVLALSCWLIAMLATLCVERNRWLANKKIVALKCHQGQWLIERGEGFVHAALHVELRLPILLVLSYRLPAGNTQRCYLWRDAVSPAKWTALVALLALYQGDD